MYVPKKECEGVSVRVIVGACVRAATTGWRQWCGGATKLGERWCRVVVVVVVVVAVAVAVVVMAAAAAAAAAAPSVAMGSGRYLGLRRPSGMREKRRCM